MQKAQKYDAVKEVREIRDKLSPEFMNHSEKLRKALKGAREKFFPKNGRKSS